ncbi:hypothetical protein N8822_01230 [Candidatus Pelagibacter ubique]|nr:hypothetical protein [Candidatus Pelagibacter ubique]
MNRSIDKKTIIIHIGYPKTGSTSLRHFLFPNHKDLNYLGRFDTTVNHLKITELLVKLKDNDFENEIDQIVKIAKNINFSEIKTNLIADEFIINYSIHYDNDGDFNRTVERTIKRAKYIFDKINVNLKVCFMIRNQSELIPSFYSNTAPELGKSMTYNADDILHFFKSKQTNNYLLKRFCDGLKFSEMYEKIAGIIGQENLKVFIFDKVKYDFKNYIYELSRYLKIDKNTSYKLMKNKSHFTAMMYLNEEIKANSPMSILFHKIKRTIKLPKEFFKNFNKKLNIAKKLSKMQFSAEYKKNKIQTKKTREAIMTQYNSLRKNSNIIKDYYKDDSIKLEKFLKEDLKKFNYY